MGVAGLAGLALTGCGDDDDDGGVPGPAGTPRPHERQRGGILRTLGGPVGATLDIHKARSAAEILLWQWAGNPLIRFSARPPYDVQPDLARALPELSPDGMNAIARLRPDAKWQNRFPLSGRAISAQDVKASFDRVKALGQNAPRSGNYSNIDSVTVQDDLTIQFKLKSPQADFYNILADQCDAIIPKELAARGAEAITKLEDVIGTGPYELASFDAGRKLEVRRRGDGYWKPDTAWLDGWQMVTVTDEGQRANSLFAGLGEIAEVSPSIARIFDQDANFQVVRSTSSARECVLINHTSGPWKDPRVRLAFARAVDRTQLYPAALEGAGVFGGPMTPAAVAWALTAADFKSLPGFGDRDTELTEARKLLAAAGLANGFDDKLTVVDSAKLPALAQVIIDNVAAAGIRLKLDTVGDFAVATDKARRGDFTLILTQLLAGIYPDAQLYLYHHSKNGAANFGKYASAELDAKLDKQRVTFDPAARLALVQDIQRYIIANPGPVWIGSRTQATVVSSRVHEYLVPPFSAGYAAAEEAWLSPE
jgi:peptide/nickel transport system substrate-binding protein